MSQQGRAARRELDARQDVLEVRVVGNCRTLPRLAASIGRFFMLTMGFCIFGTFAPIAIGHFFYPDLFTDSFVAPGLILLVAPAAFKLFEYFVLNPTTWLRVGDDGLLLYQTAARGLLSCHEFIPHHAIASFHTFDGEVPREKRDVAARDGIIMKIRDGRTLTLELGERAPEVWRRMRDARATAGWPPSTEAEHFRRSGRCVDDWIATIRSLGSASRGPYRGSRVTVDQMWGVVEARNAVPTARCGAAAALTAHLDEAGRDRMRLVARGAVARGVHEALEAAACANTSDAELAGALSRVNDGSMTARG